MFSPVLYWSLKLDFPPQPAGKPAKFPNHPDTLPMNEFPTPPYGIIEVDLFTKDVNDARHPEALKFRKVLEDVAEDYGCELVEFGVERGTVFFAFDDDLLTAEILRELEMDYGK